MKLEWKGGNRFCRVCKKPKKGYKLLCITVLVKKVNEKVFGIKYDLGNSSPEKQERGDNINKIRTRVEVVSVRKKNSLLANLTEYMS